MPDPLDGEGPLNCLCGGGGGALFGAPLGGRGGALLKTAGGTAVGTNSGNG